MIMPPTVARQHEEEDDNDQHSLTPSDDPYTYSDDSGSLSDAYFFPRSDFQASSPPFVSPENNRHYSPAAGNSHPTGISNENVPLMYPGAYPHNHRYPANGYAYYGAASKTPYKTHNVLTESIIEDSPVEQQQPTASYSQYLVESTPPLPLASTRRNRRERRRNKRRQKEAKERGGNEQKQQEQAAREEAVTQVRGKPQEIRFQDTAFAILFACQLLVVVCCAIRFGSGVVLFGTAATPDLLGMSDYQDVSATNITQGTTASMPSSAASFTIDYQNVIVLCGITGFYACVLSYLTFGFMLIIARSLIQITLIFSICLSLAWGLLGFSLDSHGLIVLTGFSVLTILLAYTAYNWRRIPFAASNLYIALCAMRCTADITLLGLGGLVVSFAWCVLWCMAFIGVVDSFVDYGACGYDDCSWYITSRHLVMYIFFGFSFVWTNAVIKNILRVTVASTIGKWIFHPEEVQPCCSAAVGKPLMRSLTYSLGPICLGSLLVSPSFILHGISSLCCCCTCKSRPRRGGKDFSGQPEEDPGESCCGICCYLLRCWNQYSFSYIGMYGYNFSEGGEKAIQLFETRQWTEVAEDNLIHTVLMMACLVIGGSTGIYAVIMEEVDGFTFTSFHKPIISAFIIGSVLGFVMANVLLLGLVGSAVNTILVCFAAGPFEFDQNHPRLSREMREEWSQQVWEPTQV